MKVELVGILDEKYESKKKPGTWYLTIKTLVTAPGQDDQLGKLQVVWPAERGLLPAFEVMRPQRFVMSILPKVFRGANGGGMMLEVLDLQIEKV